MKKAVFVIVPLIGYFGLWILGSLLFLVYFDIFNVSMSLPYNVMIQKVPTLLAILTVPVCSFTSFFLTTKVTLRKLGASLGALGVLQLGITSLVTTICLDLLITVYAQKIDILMFPTNFMYLFAWLIVIPSVVLAGYQKRGISR